MGWVLECPICMCEVVCAEGGIDDEESAVPMEANRTDADREPQPQRVLLESYSHLGCGHSFHTHCLLTSLEIKNTCPICREVPEGSISGESRNGDVGRCIAPLKLVFCRRSDQKSTGGAGEQGEAEPPQESEEGSEIATSPTIPSPADLREKARCYISKLGKRHKEQAEMRAATDALKSDIRSRVGLRESDRKKAEDLLGNLPAGYAELLVQQLKVMMTMGREDASGTTIKSARGDWEEIEREWAGKVKERGELERKLPQPAPKGHAGGTVGRRGQKRPRG